MKLARGQSSLLWPGGYRRLRSSEPERALSRPSVREPFKLAAKHAELPTQLRVHDLRHTFPSLFLVDGGAFLDTTRCQSPSERMRI
jgi:site-specific recombinase XerD